MFNDILFAFWFFLPAGIANTAPIIAAKMPVLKQWNYPMDFNITHNGQRLLGSHKTWRGIISGALAGTAVFAVQQQIHFDGSSFGEYLDSIDYFRQALVLGALLGFGALLGDAIKSFFKRFRRIPEGRRWFPFDQLDYIIGAVLLSSLAWVLPLGVYVWIFVVWFLMHLLFSYIGYKLGFKEAPL